MRRGLRIKANWGYATRSSSRRKASEPRTWRPVTEVHGRLRGWAAEWQRESSSGGHAGPAIFSGRAEPVSGRWGHLRVLRAAKAGGGVGAAWRPLYPEGPWRSRARAGPCGIGYFHARRFSGRVLSQGRTPVVGGGEAHLLPFMAALRVTAAGRFMKRCLGSRQFAPVFPLSRHDGIRCLPTARRADRAVLVELASGTLRRTRTPWVIEERAMPPPRHP